MHLRCGSSRSSYPVYIRIGVLSESDGKIDALEASLREKDSEIARLNDIIGTLLSRTSEVEKEIAQFGEDFSRIEDGLARHHAHHNSHHDQFERVWLF